MECILFGVLWVVSGFCLSTSLKQSISFLFKNCMRSFFVLLLSSIFLVGSFSSGLIVVQAQDVYSVQLQGFAWKHSTLSALIVTADNESWWNPDYINNTLRAIGQWNDGLSDFAANYSDFSYLSNVVVRWDVSNVTRGGYDLYFNWTESSLSNRSDEVGLSKTFINSDNTIVNCSINLAVHTNQGDSLRNVDMQNIALHEIGHGLGLGHSNYTGDLMYSLYTLGGPPAGVSSLDAYGVATVFSWMLKSSSFYPVSKWLTQDTVTLPSPISYQDLPVSAENTPPQTLADSAVVQFFSMILNILLQPVIAVPLLCVFVLFAILIVIPKRRKHQEVMADS
jgi:hypothetical protein